MMKQWSKAILLSVVTGISSVVLCGLLGLAILLIRLAVSWGYHLRKLGAYCGSGALPRSRQSLMSNLLNQISDLYAPR